MSKFMSWVDARSPASKIWNEHVAEYYAPKNLNFWYYFGFFVFLWIYTFFGFEKTKPVPDRVSYQQH